MQNISQAQLAFESGLSKEQISRIESGQKNVTLDTLLVIVEVLEIPIRKLFEFEY
jgi:transcriptional regulator with XRE-family HTH domain